ncbi:hypothetical protein U27_05127 [Candidatus Vecturithrix granuli]|uniref:Uncharacterized protein n=1 Tax=Vecturithrix granuli TaxID=1499967 RepID=A0A081C0P9_VECG1|nr:hypothetical protein U27_05127 [Candidatus Vecturithrix granuli]
MNYIKSKMTIIPSWSVHHQLSNLLRQRKHDLQYIWTLIRLKTQNIDSTVKNNKEAFRYHSILLKHEQINDQDWTCCQIKLFGGIFDGVVYLTNRFLPFQEGRLVRIEF